MKKLISVITAAVVIAAAGSVTALHSKADIKVETASFSVSADRSMKPAAYCRNADGSPISHEYSSSDNFCISQYAGGNATVMSCDGLPAYCIGNHLQNAPTSLMQADKYSDIPYDSEEYGAIFRMAAAGASSGTTEYGLDSTDLYYVTQCAVRSYLYGISPDSLAFYYENGEFCEAMTNDFLRISKAAEETYIPFDSSVEIDSSSAEAVPVYTDNRCYYRYGPYTPYSEYTDISYYTVDAGEHNSDVIISGFRDFISESSVTEFQAENPFYVYIDAAFEDEITLTVNSEVNIRKYNPTVYLTSDQQYQNIFQINITDSDEILSGELKLQNTDTSGDIMLNKKFLADNTEIYDLSLIYQPRFTVKNESGKFIYGIQTDGKIIFDHYSDEPVLYALSADSTLYISGLPAGEYTISEITGAEGYESQNGEISVYNSAELNTCEIINESVTTTTAVITTAETTTSEITVSETSESSDITITLTTSTYATDISETYITEETTTHETAPQTTPSSSHPSYEKTPSNPRIPHSPKTGESGTTIAVLSLILALSASVIIFTKTRR